MREQDFGFYEGKQFFERPKEGNKTGKDAHLEAHRDEPGFQDVESKESMKLRMETFVDDHLVQLLHEVEAHHSVVVVAHGIILSHLWRVLLKRFPPGNVAVLPGVQAAERGFSLEYLGGWSNTGYLELEVKAKQEKVHEHTAKGEESSLPSKANLPELESNSDPAEEPMPSTSTAELCIEASNVPQKPSIPPPLPVNAPPAPSKLPNMSLLVMAVNSQVHLKGLKKTRGGIGNLKHDSSQKTMDSFFKKRRLE